MKIVLNTIQKIFMIAILIFALILSGCKKDKPPDIEVIDVRNYYFENQYMDRIDFINKEYWIAGPIQSSLSEVEYTFVCDLEDNKITDFLHAVHEYGFLSWEEEYLPEGIIYDGHRWGIVIHFSDSTEKSIYGDNRYPETWDEMSMAFEDLSGSIVFGVSRSRE